MASRAEGSTLLTVTDAGGQQGRGRRILERREAMGIDKAPFARAAHVDRATLDRAEADTPGTRETTYATLERALDDLEAELGMADPENHPGVVRFVVRGVYGAESLVVEGPVESIAELERSVDRIMRRLASEGRGAED